MHYEIEIFFFLFTVILSLIFSSCDISGEGEANVEVQLNNFSSQKVYYWTSLNATKGLVDDNSQSA